MRSIFSEFKEKNISPEIEQFYKAASNNNINLIRELIANSKNKFDAEDYQIAHDILEIRHPNPYERTDEVAELMNLLKNSSGANMIFKSNS